MKRIVRNQAELYQTMREAIGYMRAHTGASLSAAAVAKAVSMSPSRFEHAFAQWVGTTPKRFVSHIAKERAKAVLATTPASVLQAAHACGLSGPGRLHELMVTYEAVSPGELKSGDIGITYGVHPSPFGWCLLGVTKRGVCQLSFMETPDGQEALRLLKEAWPTARMRRSDTETKPHADRIFRADRADPKRPLHLFIRGTNFQIKVWEALLAIPEGRVSNYAATARAAGFPKAVRAAGTACGRNSLAFLIPCHRVLTSGGKIGGYRWGTERKDVILAWESMRA